MQPTIICDRVALAQDAALEDVHVAVLVRFDTAAVECAAALNAAATQREVGVVGNVRTATAAQIGNEAVLTDPALGGMSTDEVAALTEAGVLRFEPPKGSPLARWHEKLQQQQRRRS